MLSGCAFRTHTLSSCLHFDPAFYPFTLLSWDAFDHTLGSFVVRVRRQSAVKTFFLPAVRHTLLPFQSAKFYRADFRSDGKSWSVPFQSVACPAVLPHTFAPCFCSIRLPVRWWYNLDSNARSYDLHNTSGRHRPQSRLPINPGGRCHSASGRNAAPAVYLPGSSMISRCPDAYFHPRLKAVFRHDQAISNVQGRKIFSMHQFIGA